MRRVLGEIIIKYCEQFVDIIDEFPMQYIILFYYPDFILENIKNIKMI